MLISLRVTGVFIGRLSALNAYRWVTLSLVAAALGYGFCKARRPIPTGKHGNSTCAHAMDRSAMGALLCGALGVVLLALAFPYVAARILMFRKGDSS